MPCSNLLSVVIGELLPYFRRCALSFALAIPSLGLIRLHILPIPAPSSFSLISPPLLIPISPSALSRPSIYRPLPRSLSVHPAPSLIMRNSQRAEFPLLPAAPTVVEPPSPPPQSPFARSVTGGFASAAEKKRRFFRLPKLITSRKSLLSLYSPNARDPLTPPPTTPPLTSPPPRSSSLKDWDAPASPPLPPLPLQQQHHYHHCHHYYHCFHYYYRPCYCGRPRGYGEGRSRMHAPMSLYPASQPRSPTPNYAIPHPPRSPLSVKSLNVFTSPARAKAMRSTVSLPPPRPTNERRHSTPNPQKPEKHSEATKCVARVTSGKTLDFDEMLHYRSDTIKMSLTPRLASEAEKSLLSD
ncbi:uncharacterized protein VTP21DRAFT_9789 [Calcarisporiella thermophila]|uniref:uncharacterized protein n=1 Tax=Calcarisporiella thermophila TaxID=911321 RepID=UPI003743EBA9